MGALAIALALTLPLPSLLYARTWSPATWGFLQKGARQLRGGAYRGRREERAAVWVEGPAPWSVRLSAFTCFLLGQLSVPGAGATLLAVGVFFASVAEEDPSVGLGLFLLAAPTGVLTAVRLLGVGIALLAREPLATDKARIAVRWEMAQSGVLLVAGAIGLSATPSGLGHLFAGLMAMASPITLAHALLLGKAAADLDVYGPPRSLPPSRA